MNPDGVWKVRYMVRSQSPFTNEEGDPDEVGTVYLQNGKISGQDPWGSEYSGEYSLNGEKITAVVKVSAYDSTSVSTFGVKYPYHFDLQGNYSSPNYFSMTGKMIEDSSKEIVLNLTRTNHI